ncbi:secretin N-terminal domain-containing protein [Porticoccus sp. W117]|uniref:secretin N-terminal domain-containing protein n=1 Tax=Porticoccus sp. W117 TaxID=3054777 RepID=UPI0025955A56|nr:secretin N-terminal domain-containing protein [Porticoccus sp. W117]MDM3870898.1 secretin N-terminal domain-containing protein [Porticoccus sp. W117]
MLRPNCLPLTFALAALMAGCAPSVQKPLPAETQLERIAAELQAPQTPEEVPSAVSDLLLGSDSTAVSASQERFDIAANDVPAGRFFLSLMDGTDINIVTGDNLKGSISLNLNDVTIEDVLEICREIYGYDYKISGNTYLISPRELSTQIFHINYLDIKRVGLSDTTVSVGRLESGSNSGNNRNGGNRNNGGGQGDSGLLSLLLADQQGNSQGGASGSSQGARIQTLTRSDFWSELKAFITSMVGGEVDGRQVMISPQAGMVVVKALPNELHDVREFLERSELSVQRQVQLEAKIIEVRLNDDYNAGINWNQIGGSLSYSYNNSRTNPTTSAFNSVFNITDINSFIDLLGEQGSVQVLSSPKQSTVNNQKAVLRVGSDEYFVTGISSDTTTSASAVVNTPDIEITPFFSGIALDVTPQISADGDIIMHVHPVITEVRDLVKPIQLGDQTFSFPTAFRDIRESDTIVRAKNGEVVVLGGLMQEVEDYEKRRYAGAGDVPVIGGLFRGKTVKVRKSELVILIKPTIIDRDTTRREVQRSRDRIRELGNEQRRLLRID